MVARAVVCSLGAPLPPAEQLLPADTAAFITIPDWSQAKAAFNSGALGQFVADPAMKSFKDKFWQKMQSDLLTPLEGKLGIKFKEYGNFLQGQVTVAVIPGGSGLSDAHYVFLCDTRDQSDSLKTNLTALLKKWDESGQKLKKDTIRDIPLTTLIFTKADMDKFLEKTFPDANKEKDAGDAEPDDDQPKNKSFNVSIGQSGSLLLVSDDLKTAEKILIRQANGMVSPLAEQAVFQQRYPALFRNGALNAWVNFQPVYDAIVKSLPKPAPGQNNMFAFDPAKVMSAIGLDGLQSAGLKLGSDAEGITAEFFASSPEAKRHGLVKIICPDNKDSSPPPFVTADVVKYTRWRLNTQAAWEGLETMLNQISPQISGLLQLTLGTIGKDKDPDFDFKKSFIGNLGDDFISVEKAPRGATEQEMQNPPSLMLIGSKNPEQLISAFKLSTSVLPPPMNASELKEREFLGKKVYSMELPAMPTADGRTANARTFSFSTSKGYLAMSTDSAFLEEFLRGNEGGKSLRDAPGLKEAAQKIGGMETGAFSYSDNRETTRLVYENWRAHPEEFEKLFQVSPLGRRPQAEEAKNVLKEWFDFSLLPPWEKVAKYFYIDVYSTSASAEGISFRAFSPTPPQLRK